MSKSKSHIVVLLLCMLYANFGYGQFQADSLKISENIQKVLSKNVSSEDSIILLLSDGISKQTPDTDDLVQYYLAYNYLVKREYEKLEKVIARNLQEGSLIKVKEVKFLNLKGSYLAFQKDYLNAVKTFLKVAEAFNRFDYTLKEATVYHNIANIYLALGDHALAHQYSSRSFDTYRKHPDDPNYLSVLGVLSICENNTNLLDSSRIHIEKGIKQLEKGPNPTGEMLLYFAKAELEFLSENYNEAQLFAMESLITSTNYNAFQFISMNSILLMNIYNKIEHYMDALTYGEKALEISDVTNNPSMHHEIVDGLSIAYAGLGNFERAYFYKNQTDSLKSIDRNRKNKSEMDSLLVRYDALENENMILSQKTDIAMKDAALSRQVNILITLCVVIIIILAFYRIHFSVIKQREEKLLLEAIQESETKLRNRLYSELHDSLLAELTVLKYELEKRDDSQKELAILKKSHGITRSIAHNLSSYLLFDEGLVKSVQDLVSNNASDIITFYTNIDKKLDLKPKVNEIIYRTIQELIQNALKHSGGTKINVQLLLNGSNLKISVEDNGKGISNEEITNSTGIRSLYKRMELINGNLNFDYSTDAGTIAIITLKV